MTCRTCHIEKPDDEFLQVPARALLVAACLTAIAYGVGALLAVLLSRG